MGSAACVWVCVLWKHHSEKDTSGEMSPRCPHPGRAIAGIRIKNNTRVGGNSMGVLCWCLSLVKGLCVSHSAGASGVPEGKSAARWLLSSASALTLRHLVTKITSSRGQIRFSPKFSVFARNWTSVRSVRSGPRSCRPRVFLERDPLLSPPLLRVNRPLRSYTSMGTSQLDRSAQR